MSATQTHVYFRKKLPGLKNYSANSFVLYDQILVQKSADFKKWIRGFKYTLPVKSGEKVKSLENFPTLATKVLEICSPIASRQMTFIVIGGGSVLDLGGFLSSVLKRGTDLILIPSTWLAAIDSAHGGKNGLNHRGLKNQWGTFHFPKQVEVIEDLLKIQPQQRACEAMGEILKIFLISSRKNFSQLRNLNELDHKALFFICPKAIQSKYKIIKVDPFETKGRRLFLNFGHTLAHAFENQFQIPHGEAVFYGVVFNLIWSRWIQVLSEKEYEYIIQSPIWLELFNLDRYRQLLTLKESDLSRAIMQDKKRNSQGLIHEPFLKACGKGQIRKIKVQDFVKELRRQKKLLNRVLDGN